MALFPTAYKPTAQWILYIAGYLFVLIGTPIVMTIVVGSFISCWEKILAGPMTAAVIVVYSYAAAPRYSTYAAIGGFIIGAVLAYYALVPHIVPTCITPYSPTYLALATTYFVGLLSLGGILWASKCRR